MRGETDTILYLTNEAAADPLVPSMLSAGWDVDVVTDVASARERLGNNDIGLGLARLDPDPLPWFEQGGTDVCTAEAAVPWLGLVHPAHMLDARFNRELRAAFCGVEALPAEFKRVDAMLRLAGNLRAPARGEPAVESESEMVAASPPMLAVFRDIRKVAPTDAPVLITGESGTGKELAAQAIHERSSRGKGPFIAVNCAALPASLIQSELFGHEKGAFTGAAQRKIGSFEAANKGTLFLDEIGDLPLELQVTLLRFLQEGTIQRVGSNKEISLDVRVVAATHVNLERHMAAGKFREDLFFRLNVLRLEMPPLRERGGDIELLAHYFFKQFAGEGHPRLEGFSKDALERMSAHEWQGNVRELINRVRRAVVMCDGRLIRSADLDLSTLQRPKMLLTLEEARAAAESQAVRAALELSRNNLSKAAAHLRVSRPKLYRLLEKYDLKPLAG